MTKRPRSEGADDDKTPSQPHKLKTGTALNVLDLGATAMQLARRYDRAERDKDGVTMATVGLALIDLGRDISKAGVGIVGQGKRRGA